MNCWILNIVLQQPTIQDAFVELEICKNRRLSAPEVADAEIHFHENKPHSANATELWPMETDKICAFNNLFHK